MPTKTFFVLLGALATLPCCTNSSQGPGGTAQDHLADKLCDWQPYPGNPLIEPPGSETLIGDPTVLRPDEAPDNQWHLFANSLLGIHQYVSDNGIDWTEQPNSLGGAGAVRPFVFQDGGSYHLLYEKFLTLSSSEIRRIDSPDLETWSNPVTVLVPKLAWEQTAQSTIGNPYLVRRNDVASQPYFLYYSADGVYQPDTGFSEPRVIGLARSDSLDGPWTRNPEPLIAPSADDPWENRGAGSIKLLDEKVDGRFIALNNGIYQTQQGVSGSAIRVLSSADGLEWSDVCGKPILAPDGKGWDAAFVYAFDTTRVGDGIRVYYNARDGYKQATERIGMATLKLPPQGP